MYIKIDSSLLNRLGYPKITSERTDAVWTAEGSQPGWIYVSGTSISQIVPQYEWIPGANVLTSYAYNSGQVVNFYDNKDAKIKLITDAYNAAVDTVTAGYPEQMQRSWQKKSRLAFEYDAMDSSSKSGCISNPDYNILVQEANQRGISLDTLIVEKILPKAIAFETAHGTYTGKWSKMVSEVLALSGTEQEIYSGLVAINIDF